MTEEDRDVLLETRLGALLGRRVGVAGDVEAFKGIPFAVPPVGARRWRPAEPAPAWSDVRRADHFGPDCVQPSTLQLVEDPVVAYFRHVPSLCSEDCLYLNVWTPAGRSADCRLPVMVWIHGGGLVLGSGSWPLYDGAELARKGVVLVTFNYRLGIFGHFAHPELSAESADGVSGNYATSDQIQALRWVRDHISSFGGDPNNVTLFGVSGGSISISALMSSPPARGLFHRAIGQSGAAFYRRFPLIGDAESAGAKFAIEICKPNLKDLREMPANDLLNVSRLQGFMDHHSTGPVVDGHLFPEQPYELFRRGGQYRVPVILGFTSDEECSDALSGIAVDKDIYLRDVRATYGDAAELYLTLFPPSNPRSPPRRELGGAVDGWSWAMEAWARMMTEVSTTAYLYYFAHVPPGAKGAFHTSEVSYVFNNVKNLPRGFSTAPVLRPRACDLRMAETMSSYWTNFAKTGSPNGQELPTWCSYSKSKRECLKFEAGDAHTEINLFRGAWDIKDRVYSYWINSIKSCAQ